MRPAGDYKLQVTSNSAVVDRCQRTRSRRSACKPGGKYDLTLPLTGGHPGDGAVSIKLSNAVGLSLEQSVYIPVRPAALPVTERRLITHRTRQAA